MPANALYVGNPSYKELRQGDVFRIRIANVRFPLNRPEDAFRAGAHVFEGDIEEGVFAVVSHDCDITDDKVDDYGRTMNPDKNPVVLAKIRRPEPGLEKVIVGSGGFERINDVRNPSFYDLFYYPDLPGVDAPHSVANLSDLWTVTRKILQPKAKLAELTEQARYSLRVKMILHFGRGNDKDHPLEDFSSGLTSKEDRHDTRDGP